jgi:hypothetical protein
MIRTATFAVIGLTATFGAAQSQQRCAPIQIPASGSATIQGNAPADTPFACYILNGAAGKSATIKITKPSRGVAFNIASVAENQDNVSFKTDAKPYHIDVYDMGRGGSTPFTMQVTVK